MSRKPLKSMKLNVTTFLAIQNKKNHELKKLKKRIYSRMANLFLPYCSYKRIHSNPNAFISELISNKILNATKECIPNKILFNTINLFFIKYCVCIKGSSNIGCALIKDSIRLLLISNFCVTTSYNKQDKWK